MSELKKNTPVWLVVVGLLILLQSLVATELALYGRNTLSQHPEWKLGKSFMARHLMGVIETESTRNILAQNKLHLDVWHGFHEVFWTRPVQPEKLSCRLQIEPGGIATILYAGNADRVEGLRLSRRDGAPSAYVVRNREGRFLEKEPLPDLSLEGESQQVTLLFKTDFVEVSVNGTSLTKLPAPPRQKLIVGFSGQAERVTVDDVRIWEAGKLVLDEDFRNSGFKNVFPPVFLVFLVLSTLLALVLRWRGSDNKRHALKLTMLNVSILGLLTMLFAFDYLLWSNLYPYQGLTPWGRKGHLSQAESLRLQLVDLIAPWNPEPSEISSKELEILLGYHAILSRGEGVRVTSEETYPFAFFEDAKLENFAGDEDALRVLLVGTSQSWGAGAVDLENLLQVQLYRHLKEATAGKVIVYNISESGSRARILLERYKGIAHQVQPQFAVLNLSNNDKGEPDNLESSLQEFIELVEKSGGRVLLVEEPNSPQFESKIEKGHRVMQKVAERNSTAVLPLHQELGDLDDTGRLWHDVVHLTSYGQELAASRMSEALIEMGLGEGK